MDNEPNVLVEKGEDPTRLIIAFTGAAGGLTMQPYDFFQMTDLLRNSRILLRDPSRRFYLGGIAPQARGIDRLIDLLRRERERLAPDVTVSTGTSSGGFAALLMGHLLQVDEVHSFAPRLPLFLPEAIRTREWKAVRNHWVEMVRGALLATSPRIRRFINLTKLLSDWNGRTDYVVHVCEQHARDLRTAELFSSCPHVSIRTYSCAGHNVAYYLARKQKLISVFARDAQGEHA